MEGKQIISNGPIHVRPESGRIVRLSKQTGVLDNTVPLPTSLYVVDIR